MRLVWRSIRDTLRIDCEGLSRKRIGELADELGMMFRDVDVSGEHITASNLLSARHYAAAIQLIERFGVRLTI